MPTTSITLRLSVEILSLPFMCPAAAITEQLEGPPREAAWGAAGHIYFHPSDVSSSSSEERQKQGPHLGFMHVS